MPIFAKAETQVRKVMRDISHEIKSVGTNRNYRESLTRVCAWLKANGDRNGLKNISKEKALAYLQSRSPEISQKSLDLERQALQKIMQHYGTLQSSEKLTIIKSSKETTLKPRAYTAAQVQAISEHQSPKYALSTQIAYCAGLRAHELFTLERINEKQPHLRPQKTNEQRYGEHKFAGRENFKSYVVTGKGGHIREVKISPNLAEKLEQKRLDTPRTIVDRGVKYTQKYDIGGGQSWSQNFSRSSKAVLGFSTGAHGLRHSYAQERADSLFHQGFTDEAGKAIVSLEMGHYRETITEVYLR